MGRVKNAVAVWLSVSAMPAAASSFAAPGGRPIAPVETPYGVWSGAVVRHFCDAPNVTVGRVDGVEPFHLRLVPELPGGHVPRGG